jgi:hypothetical protein
MNVQLTKNEQLVGLLTGAWSPEASAAFRTASHRDLLTVKRGDLLEFLKGNPQIAQDYLKRWEALRPAADINVMWKEKDGYKVAWMAWGGQPSLIREFKDLNEAVAEHVCRQSGILE